MTDETFQLGESSLDGQTTFANEPNLSITPAEAPAIGWGEPATRDLEFWAVGGEFPIPAIDETMTNDSLELTLRPDAADVEDHLRPMFNAAQGQVDIVEFDDGRFEAFDTSTSGNIFQLAPPVDERPPREPREYLIDGYDETVIDREGLEYEVELSFVPVTSKEPSPSTIIDEDPDQDEWLIDVEYGSVATARVEKDVQRSDDTLTLSMVLDGPQTHAIERSGSRIPAVRQHEVPDGDNLWEDLTPNDHNTIEITPSEDDNSGAVEAGEYILVDWESARMSFGRFQVSITVADPT